ncbi:cathepsin F [Acrasis kona]|uniref:Cathepsin F n=1 Tax=Acrasis kona TaxID=1008807 RepID=A0AAW2Z0X7_9EUKA
MIKQVLLIAALAIIVAAYKIPTEEQIKEKFGRFIFKYDKRGYEGEVFEKRYKYFRSNVINAHLHNAIHNTSTMGVNQFYDLSPEEFRRSYLMKPRTPEFLLGSMKGALPSENFDARKAPESFDWREKGAVTKVKNQGNCGSCWAFSATGNIEGVNFIKNKKLVSLSEQNLVDCDHVCVKFEGEEACDNGCDGGLMWSAFQYVQKAGGIDTEKKYPYEGVDDSCSFKKDEVGAKVSGWKKLPTNEDELAAALVENGPISVAINAEPVQWYSSGILSGSGCDPKALDHGVLIVGYGVEKGKKFWIVKNSWGPGWGEEGFFRIARGVNACGIASVPTTAIAK